MVSGDAGELFQSQYGALKSAFRLAKNMDIIEYGKKVIQNTAATKDERSAAHYYLAKTYLKMGETENAVPSLTFVDQNTNNNKRGRVKITCWQRFNSIKKNTPRLSSSAIMPMKKMAITLIGSQKVYC